MENPPGCSGTTYDAVRTVPLLLPLHLSGRFLPLVAAFHSIPARLNFRLGKE